MKWHLSFLWSNPRRRVLVALTLGLGAAYALTIVDAGFILGYSAYWTHPYGDRMNNLIGAVYFAHDQWRFPLFYVPKLAFPEGANIIFTDSLPLLALVFKVVFQATGTWFNYFGLWLFACFPLLAVFAALAAREAGTTDALSQIGVALIALACPAFLFRFGHAALMAHFLVAWSIYLYFRLRNVPDDRAAIAQFCVVSALAILLQAYFVIMVIPVLVAALAQALIEKRLTLKRAGIGLASVGTALIATAWIAGLIGREGAPATQWGFGHYSMNLLSPILPPRAHLPEAFARMIKWDGTLTWDANGGQLEGYNYLGAGLLLLAAVHLVASWRLMGGALRRHVFLVLLLLGYFLFALSNRMFAGNWLVWEFAVPAPLAPLVGHFRTGGRLFWPIYYVLAIALVVATYRRFDPRTARILIVAAVALQLADTQIHRETMAKATRQGYPKALPEEVWTALLAKHEYFKQYPSYQCGGWAGKFPENHPNLELLWLAAKLDKPSNSAYLARTSRDCEKEKREGLGFQVDEKGLYVYGNNFDIKALAAMPRFGDWCRTFDHGVACTRHWASVPAAATATYFNPAGGGFALPAAMAQTLKFSAGGNGVPLLGRGWSVLEGWGVWTLGKDSEIDLRIPASAKGSLRLAVKGYAFVHSKRPSQEIAVYANNAPVGSWIYSAGEGAKIFNVDVPASAVGDSGVLKVRLVPKVVESPMQAGVSADPRMIGFALIEMTISPAPTATPSAGRS
jgi:hypothetical protein